MEEEEVERSQEPENQEICCKTVSLSTPTKSQQYDSLTKTYTMVTTVDIPTWM